jgi:hypothetical protein
MKNILNLPDFKDVLATIKQVSKGADAVARHFQHIMTDINLAESVLTNGFEEMEHGAKKAMIDQLTKRLTFATTMFSQRHDNVIERETVFILSYLLAMYLKLSLLRQEKSEAVPA